MKLVPALAAALLTAACGGGDKSTGSTTTPSHARADDSNDGVVVPPETMDEIQRALDRKRNVVARCLSSAVDAEELPKNAHGRMTLGFVIGPSGKAREIKIIKSSLSSKILTDCVVSRVEEIEFPSVPQALPWSYTYGFEAM